MLALQLAEGEEERGPLAGALLVKKLVVVLFVAVALELFAAALASELLAVACASRRGLRHKYFAAVVEPN